MGHVLGSPGRRPRGVSPTFYLRQYFKVPPIPFYLSAHGIALTCWFVLLVVQASLVASGRTAVHRRLGVAGVPLALSIPIQGVWFNLKFPARIVELSGAPPDALLPRLTEGFVAGMIAALFSGVFLGVAFFN